MLYLDIFDRQYIDSSPVAGVSTPNDINYLRRVYRFNHDAIQKYYIDRNFRTRNTHILARFLEHISPQLGYDDFRFLEYVDQKVTYLAKHFKLTSDIEKGLVHPPHFYGNGGEEIILVEYEHFDVVDIVKNWRTASCMRILKHTRNDINLLLPLGNNDGSRGGLSVILLNPMKLALKYRQFIKEEAKKRTSESEDEIYLNKTHFLMKYVLPTTMEDNIDFVFMNKLMDKYYGREEVTPKAKHRFKLYEPTTQIDRYVDQTLEVVTSRKLDFINIMRNMKLIFVEDVSRLLELPTLGGTRQSRWAMLASRLEMMCFIYDVAVDKERSRTIINDWQRLVTRIERDRGFLGSFSSIEATKIKEYMDRIKAM